MKYLHIVFLFLFSIHCVGQQNLVQNSGFEDTVSCPAGGGQLNKSVGWSSWTAGTPDFFHSCIGATSAYGVPNNIYGYQPPLQGNAYLGIVDLAKNSSSSNYKEYAYSQITPMLPGAVYQVSIWVALSNVSKCGSNGLGIFFFKTGPTFYGNTYTTPAVTPQVSYANYGPITDTVNWTKLSSVFLADSAYSNIVLGSFLSYSQAAIDTFNPAGVYYNTFYYIDSIEVKLLDSFEFVYSDTVFCAGDTVNLQYSALKGYSSSNIFTAQLSDASGSFNTPINIGTRASTTSGTITCVLPTSLASGTGYKIRLLSSNVADTTEDYGVTIDIGAGISKPIASSDSVACENDTLQLSASSNTSGVSYSWTGPGAFSSNLQNPTIVNPTSTRIGDYILTTKLFGCTAKDTTKVYHVFSANTTSTIATSNAPICLGDTLKLYSTSINSGLSYSWIGPGNFSAAIQNPDIAATATSMSGDYIVAATNGYCISKDTISVIVKPTPVNFGANYNSPLCERADLIFTGTTTSSGVSWQWSGPNSFSSTLQSPVLYGSVLFYSGDYYVTADLNGCSITDTVTVLVKPLPANFDALGDTVCAGETAQLQAATTSTGVSFAWTGPGSFTSTTQNNSLTNTITSQSGVYTVNATLNGCSTKDSTRILVHASPAAVTLSTNPVCEGDILQLSSTTSTTGAGYTWTGPNSFTATTRNTTINNAPTTATGWYKMTVALNNCTYIDSIAATVNGIPSAPTISYNSPLCERQELVLLANTVQGATYSWTGPGGYSQTGVTPTRANMQFADAGTYRATVTVNNCTSLEDTVNVTVVTAPSVSIASVQGDTICTGDMVQLNATPANHGGAPGYQWYINKIPAGTSSPYSTNLLKDGDTVYCVMTEYTQCSSAYKDTSTAILMSVLPWETPTVSITSTADTIKSGGFIAFGATQTHGGQTPQYQWKLNGNNIGGAISAVWSANTLIDKDEVCVEMTSSYRCPSPPTVQSNCITVIVRNPADVNDINKQQYFTLYPNPNDGKFILKGKLSKNEPVNIQVHNTVGAVLYHETVIPRSGTLNTTIELNDLASGTYFVRLQSSSGMTVIPFTAR